MLLYNLIIRREFLVRKKKAMVGKKYYNEEREKGRNK